MKSIERVCVRAFLFLHLSCSFRAVCAFQVICHGIGSKSTGGRGCQCVRVCRNRTGVHAMRARRLKGPRGQAMTQSNRNGKRALLFCFGFCVLSSTRGMTGWFGFLCGYWLWINVFGWVGWISLLRAGPTGTRDEFVVVS